MNERKEKEKQSFFYSLAPLWERGSSSFGYFYSDWRNRHLYYD